MNNIIIIPNKNIKEKKKIIYINFINKYIN